MNELADENVVVITDNETVYQTDDTAFSVQGGVNKVVFKWWGRKSYMSTARANGFVDACTNVSISAGYVGAGAVGLFSGLASGYFAKLAYDVDNRNDGHQRGIIANFTWAAVYWTEKQ